MNCLIGGTYRQRYRDAEPGININVSGGCVKPAFGLNSVNKHTTGSTSLPWEILESAYFCFRHKGYEKTTIQDVCSRLDINSNQFYKYFESLDEVLEILWAR